MRFTLRFSRVCVHDIQRVLLYTLEQFGPRKHEQYKGLVREAVADIRHDPRRPPARAHPEIGAHVFTFHIARRGKRARHYFLYRVANESVVEVGRFLHDAMELRRHVPERWGDGG